jgi:hypothetical protein
MYSQVVGNLKFDKSLYHQITIGVNFFARKKDRIAIVLRLLLSKYKINLNGE